MSAAMGPQIQIGVDPASTTSTELYEGMLTGLDVQEQLVDAAGLRGTLSHDATRVRQGTRAPKFQITLQPNYAELLNWLPRILGGTFALNACPLAETLPTFVVVMDLIAKRWQWTGCVVSKAVFQSQQGQPLNLTLDVEAADVTPVNTAFTAGLSISTIGPFLHSDLVLSVSGTGYNWREATLEIAYQQALDRFFNNLTRQSIPTQERTITWRLDGPYGDNSALYGLAVGGAAIVGTWTNGAHSLAFSSTKVAFPRKPPTIQGRQEIMLPLEGIARADFTQSPVVRELTCVCQ